MIKKFGLLLSITLLPLTTSASEDMLSSFKESLRPYMEKYLGEEMAVTILGAAPEKIKLPRIPEIKRDARSTEIYDYKLVKEEKMSKEKRGQSNLYFLKEIYKATFDRLPSEDEMERWMNTLEQGGSREGIYRALVLSTTYDELEKYNDPPTDRLIQFTHEFLQKYINIKVEERALRDMNLHSIKRVCVEKSLELLDVFQRQPNSLYDWYAVLSGQLARDFGQELNSSLRSNPSLEFHRQWAVEAPLDIIKSEVIIKLHKAFNTLR